MLIKPDSSPAARIIVVGVGGAGCNAVNTMISMDIQNVQFVAMNTDKQALDSNLAPNKIVLGQETTKGLGAGGNWEIGKAAAEEDIEIIHETLAGADMVFITAGMGGGTGTGAAPVVAGIAKGLGALTIGVVYQPFNFEGRRRAENAKRGLDEMKDKVDTLLTIPNQKILETIDRKVSFIEAMKKGDDVLGQAIKSISDIITVSGFMNVDFADVKSVMKDAGSAVMGMGLASGDDRAIVATRQAISSPLLDLSIGGAKNALVSITGNRELSMHEISEAMEIVQQYLSDEANVIVGAAIDDKMDKDIKVTVLATGFADKTVMSPNVPTQRPTANYQQPVFQHQPINTQQAPVQPQVIHRPQQTQPEDFDITNYRQKPQEEEEYLSTSFKKSNQNPAFPEASRKGANDINQNDEDITQIPAFIRRNAFNKK
ncbi:MAG: cell division protein FtsZ [bacterium]